MDRVSQAHNLSLHGPSQCWRVSKKWLCTKLLGKWRPNGGPYGRELCCSCLIDQFVRLDLINWGINAVNNKSHTNTCSREMINFIIRNYMWNEILSRKCFIMMWCHVLFCHLHQTALHEWYQDTLVMSLLKIYTGLRLCTIIWSHVMDYQHGGCCWYLNLFYFDSLIPLFLNIFKKKWSCKHLFKLKLRCLFAFHKYFHID